MTATKPILLLVLLAGTARGGVYSTLDNDQTFNGGAFTLHQRSYGHAYGGDPSGSVNVQLIYTPWDYGTSWWTTFDYVIDMPAGGYTYSDNQFASLVLNPVGDYTSDGFVGQSDLNSVLDLWGTGNSTELIYRHWPPSDGIVGQKELNEILANWGVSRPTSLASVPEPSAWWLAVAAAMMWAAWRMRR